MKKAFYKRAIFVSKSMLWTVLLYIGIMLAFNWDEVGRAFDNGNVASIVHTATDDCSDNITGTGKRHSIVSSLLRLVKNVSGFTSIITSHE